MHGELLNRLRNELKKKDEKFVGRHRLFLLLEDKVF